MLFETDILKGYPPYWNWRERCNFYSKINENINWRTELKKNIGSWGSLSQKGAKELASFVARSSRAIISLTLVQREFSGSPVAIQFAWKLVPSVHCNGIGEKIIDCQCVSGVLPVCLQWSFNGFPVCSSYAKDPWIATGTPLGDSCD